VQRGSGTFNFTNGRGSLNRSGGANMNDDQSDFNKVLARVLKLRQETSAELVAITIDTPGWYLCRGKLVALQQVLGFFSSIDAKRFGASAGM